MSNEIYHEPQLLRKFKTRSNPKGICALCSDKVATIVMVPGQAENSLQVYDSEKSDAVDTLDLEEDFSVIAASINGGVFVHTDEKG